MATFYIEQFGCRATQADAAAIERQLLQRGYALSPDKYSADVVVVNTCTVTAAADTQARQAIHGIHEENPAARIVVTGCYAQRAPENLAKLDGVAWVVGNSHKPEIPRLIEKMNAGQMNGSPLPAREDYFVALGEIQRVPDLRRTGPAEILIGNIMEQSEFLAAPVEGGEAGHTRPVLKIQDGCDSRCSFCIIPQVRGRSRSLAPDMVIHEMDKLISGGAREIVLSGIDLGSYGRDLGPHAVAAGSSSRIELIELLRRILEETAVERLRVSSIEPMDVTEDLIALFAANERLARHFHMPLQSGSDRILGKMRRWYRAEHYARRVELVHEWLPEAAIGADVMAGFPGETEDDHRATLALIEGLPLTYLHVFSFSARPGTPAANMPEQVPDKVITRRAQELRSLGEKKKVAFRAAQAGRTLQVLTLHGEGTDAAVSDATGRWTRALSGNYIDMRVTGHWPANQMLAVRAEIAPTGYILGRPIENSVRHTLDVARL